MRAILGIVGLLAVLATGYFIYFAQVRPAGNATAPIQQINLVRVRTELLSLAQSERSFLAATGSYGTLEQLRQSGNLSFLERRNPDYTYEVEIDGAAHFCITAKPVSADAGLPTLSIDETMQISP
ncbi:MAG TPA: hypothetical protein VE398_05375 [Acidobacteriota bacterium]|nr:hypothetical protein [Acidobacteriota bacterium]